MLYGEKNRFDESPGVAGTGRTQTSFADHLFGKFSGRGAARRSRGSEDRTSSADAAGAQPTSPSTSTRTDITRIPLRIATPPIDGTYRRQPPSRRVRLTSSTLFAAQYHRITPDCCRQERGIAATPGTNKSSDRGVRGFISVGRRELPAIRAKHVVHVERTRLSHLDGPVACLLIHQLVLALACVQVDARDLPLLRDTIMNRLSSLRPIPWPLECGVHHKRRQHEVRTDDGARET